MSKRFCITCGETFKGSRSRCSNCSIRSDARVKHRKPTAGICANCHELYRSEDLEIDHIKPMAWGGSDSPDNLQLLCKKCHRSKTNFENNGRRPN